MNKSKYLVKSHDHKWKDLNRFLVEHWDDIYILGMLKLKGICMHLNIHYSHHPFLYRYGRLCKGKDRWIVFFLSKIFIFFVITKNCKPLKDIDSFFMFPFILDDYTRTNRWICYCYSSFHSLNKNMIFFYFGGIFSVSKIFREKMTLINLMAKEIVEIFNGVTINHYIKIIGLDIGLYIFLNPIIYLSNLT